MEHFVLAIPASMLPAGCASGQINTTARAAIGEFMLLGARLAPVAVGKGPDLKKAARIESALEQIPPAAGQNQGDNP